MEALELMHKLFKSATEQSDVPTGLKDNYLPIANQTLDHLSGLPDKPILKFMVHEASWATKGTTLTSEKGITTLKLSTSQSEDLKNLLARLEISTKLPLDKYNHGMTSACIGNMVPGSCMPGTLTLFDGANSREVSHPNVLLVQTQFHVFTNTGCKKRELMDQPIVELMGLVNQLYAMSYIAEPTMLYQLVAIALDKPMSELYAKKAALREDLVHIELLNNIFFVEGFKYFSFAKPRDPNLDLVTLDQAFDLLQGCFYPPLATAKHSTTEHSWFLAKGESLIKGLMRSSAGLDRSGFVMQVQQRRRTLDEHGNTVAGEILAIQYQVVKVQELYYPKSNKTEFELYFSGAPGDHTVKIAANRLCGHGRKPLTDLLTKNMQKNGTGAEFYVAFYRLSYHKAKETCDANKRLAAKLIYRSYCSVLGTDKAVYQYAERPRKDEAFRNIRSNLGLPWELHQIEEAISVSDDSWHDYRLPRMRSPQVRRGRTTLARPREAEQKSTGRLNYAHVVPKYLTDVNLMQHDNYMLVSSCALSFRTASRST